MVFLAMLWVELFLLKIVGNEVDDSGQPNSKVAGKNSDLKDTKMLCRTERNCRVGW